MSSDFVELIVGAQPGTCGAWLRIVDDTWPDWSKPAPEDYWCIVAVGTGYGTHGKADGEKVRLTVEQLRAAAARLAAGEITVSREIRRNVQDALEFPEDADIDAIAADCVMQTAVFGEIVYS